MGSSKFYRAVISIVAALLLHQTTLHADIPPGYYDAVDESTMTKLRKTLHEVIDDHKRFPYSSSAPDTWNILEKADEDPANSSNIIDLYRNTSLPKEGGGNAFYNREHSDLCACFLILRRLRCAK